MPARCCPSRIVRQPGLTTYDAKDPDTSFPPIEPLLPPEGAPNVLIVLLDDVGFGASSVFGGPCNTPTAERLAGGGVRFNRFHTTALCAPTRAALLSGRNHHSVGMGSITETATSAPGNSSLRPNTKAPLAMTLKLNGYSTAQFGKCHEVPVWQSSPMGPFDAWPSAGGGFEYFYGFIGGENNQWDPALYNGTTPVEPPATPEEGYHLTEDLADHAISWVRQQKALMPDKPFFVYFAPGATHAPHHVPKEWADRYAGQFDDGWDAQRDAHVRPPARAGCHPGRRRTDGAPRRDPGLGRHARRAQAGAGPRDGGVRRVPRAHRLPRRPARRRHRGPRDPRRHVDLLHHRRQRGVGRGHVERGVQRDGQLQRDGRPGDAGVHDLQDGRVGFAELVQPLRGRLGVGDGHAVPVDQAGRLALGRHPQRHHRALAQRDRRSGWAARAVHACHRRRPDDPRSRRVARADDGERRAAVADGGQEHALCLQRRGSTGAPRPAVLRDVRQSRHLPQGVERSHQAQDAMGDGRWRDAGVRRRPVGALRRHRRLQPGPRPRRRAPRDARPAATAVADRGGQVRRGTDG